MKNKTLANKTLANNILLAEYYANCKFQPVGNSNFFIRKQYTDDKKTENEIELYHRFPIANDYIKFVCNTEIGKTASLKFDWDWSWLIAVFSKLYKEDKLYTYAEIVKKGHIVINFHKAIENNDIETAYKNVVEFLNIVKNA